MKWRMWERCQGMNGCESWYQNMLLKPSVNSPKVFGGGEHLEANGLE
jgi:hypothetical protein